MLTLYKDKELIKNKCIYYSTHEPIFFFYLNKQNQIKEEI